MGSPERWIYTGDGIHLSGGLLLAGWILRTGTCRGISGRSQTIAAIANFAKFAYSVGEYNRYSLYQIILTSIMALESIVVLYLILIKYKKTVEKAYDTFWIEVIIIISGVLAIVNNEDASDPFDVIYACSYYLESVSLLPQLYFNFRTGSKNLCISMYVLVNTVYKSFHVYYAVTTDHYYAPVSLYPGYIQLATYALYFAMLILIPKYKEEKIVYDFDSISASLDDYALNNENQPPTIIVTRPALDRQQSRLEMPFLKKTLPSMSSLATYNANGSHSSSTIDTPSVQNKSLHKKLKHVASTPNFKSGNDKPKRKRTHSASSIVSLGRQSFSDSLDDGLVLLSRETAREGRQRRIAYSRQASLPEPNSSKVLPDEEQKRDESIQGLYKEEFLAITLHPGVDSDPQVEPKYESSRKFSKSDIDALGKRQATQHDVKDQMEYHVANGIQANHAETLRKVSEPTRIKQMPGGETRRKRTISTSPEFRQKHRRATMHHLAHPHQQHNWKVLASTFIGMSPPMRRPSSPSSAVSHLPDSEDEHVRNAHSPRSDHIKKRRATVQALNLKPQRHQPNWKNLASGLIGTSPTPHSPKSARFSLASPITDMRRTVSVTRSHSDSKCADTVKKRPRANVLESPRVPTRKKRTSWQKLTDGFIGASPLFHRRASSPMNHEYSSKDEKTKGRKPGNSQDRDENTIPEDLEGKG